MTTSDWVARRVPTDLVHLDVAASGRPSTTVLAAELAHLLAEAERGGYVAQADAAGVVDGGRATLAAMVGLSAADICFVDGAGTAFATMVEAWPLPRGARIGYCAGEYGANARLLRRLAPQRGWELVLLPVDEQSRVRDVPPGLDLLTVPQVASQRGVAQPVGDLLATGVPLLLDVAQSLGQVPVPAGCAAYVGTSRKWLCGPRGVGFAVVAPAVQASLAEPPTLAPAHGDGMLRWESQEAHVAGRVGLALAAGEWSPPVGRAAVEVAAYGREVLARVPGWTVREDVEEPTGITTLVGGDPVAARAALLERGLLVSAVPTSRSDDLSDPVLRVSTAAWVQREHLDALAAALALGSGA